MRNSEPYLIAIMGSTASGKSDLAEKLAQDIQAELINADAFQVYKGLDIGTNKPLSKNIYHLIDIKDPTDGFGVGEWIQNVLPILKKAYDIKKNVIVVGGTGLYIRALFEQWNHLNPIPPLELRKRIEIELKEQGIEALFHQLQCLSPEVASKIDSKNPVRVSRALEKIMDPRPPFSINLPPFKKLKFGIEKNLDSLHHDIDQRVYQMIEQGWIKEVSSLLSNNIPSTSPGMRAIGYQTLTQYLQKELSLDEAIEKIQILTRQYAKRQRTWLRSEPNLIFIAPHIKDIYSFL